MASVGPQRWVADAVVVRRIPGKGRGLVVDRPVQQDEPLMVCDAFVAGPLEDVVNATLAKLRDPRRCPAHVRSQFFALDDGCGSTDQDVSIDLFRPVATSGASVKTEIAGDIDERRVKRILCTNSQSIDSMYQAMALGLPPRGLVDMHAADKQLDGHVALWLLPSLLNHSCAPTVSWAVLATSPTWSLAFYAACDLPVGTELTDSYINLFQTAASRIDELRTQKSFICRCFRCEWESKGMPAEMVQALCDRATASNDAHQASSNTDDWLREIQGITRACVAVVTKFKGRALEVADAVDDEAWRWFSCAAMSPVFMDRCSALDRVMLAMDRARETRLGSLDMGDIAKHAADACDDALRIVEQVAPTSAYHVHFLTMRYRLLCRLKLCRRGGGGGSISPYRAATELLAVWTARHRALADAKLLGDGAVGSSIAYVADGFIEAITKGAGALRDCMLETLLRVHSTAALGSVEKPPSRCGSVLAAVAAAQVRADDTDTDQADPSGHEMVELNGMD